MSGLGLRLAVASIALTACSAPVPLLLPDPPLSARSMVLVVIRHGDRPDGATETPYDVYSASLGDPVAFPALIDERDEVYAFYYRCPLSTLAVPKPGERWERFSPRGVGFKFDHQSRGFGPTEERPTELAATSNTISLQPYTFPLVPTPQCADLQACEGCPCGVGQPGCLRCLRSRVSLFAVDTDRGLLVGRAHASPECAQALLVRVGDSGPEAIPLEGVPAGVVGGWRADAETFLATVEGSVSRVVIDNERLSVVDRPDLRIPAGSLLVAGEGSPVGVSAEAVAEGWIPSMFYGISPTQTVVGTPKDVCVPPLKASASSAGGLVAAFGVLLVKGESFSATEVERMPLEVAVVETMGVASLDTTKLATIDLLADRLEFSISETPKQIEALGLYSDTYVVAYVDGSIEVRGTEALTISGWGQHAGRFLASRCLLSLTTFDQDGLEQLNVFGCGQTGDCT